MQFLYKLEKSIGKHHSPEEKFQLNNFREKGCYGHD
jgi:hypothetical protein